MQLKVMSVAGDSIRLRLEGKIAATNAADGDEPIQSLLGPDVYTRRVLLNLEKCEYCDSMGVSWLLNCHRRFREAGGMLVLHSIPPLTMQVLRVLHLEKVLNLAETETAAQAKAAEVVP